MADHSITYEMWRPLPGGGEDRNGRRPYSRVVRYRGAPPRRGRGSQLGMALRRRHPERGGAPSPEGARIATRTAAPPSPSPSTGGAPSPEGARIATRPPWIARPARLAWRPLPGGARIATTPSPSGRTASGSWWRPLPGGGEDRNTAWSLLMGDVQGSGAPSPEGARIATPSRRAAPACCAAWRPLPGGGEDRNLPDWNVHDDAKAWRPPPRTGRGSQRVAGAGDHRVARRGAPSLEGPGSQRRIVTHHDPYVDGAPPRRCGSSG